MEDTGRPMTIDGFAAMMPRVQAVMSEACSLLGLPPPPVEPTIFECNLAGDASEGAYCSAHAARNGRQYAVYAMHRRPDLGTRLAISAARRVICSDVFPSRVAVGAEEKCAVEAALIVAGVEDMSASAGEIASTLEPRRRHLGEVIRRIQGRGDAKLDADLLAFVRRAFDVGFETVLRAPVPASEMLAAIQDRSFRNLVSTSRLPEADFQGAWQAFSSFRDGFGVARAAGVLRTRVNAPIAHANALRLLEEMIEDGAAVQMVDRLWRALGAPPAGLRRETEPPAADDGSTFRPWRDHA